MRLIVVLGGVQSNKFIEKIALLQFVLRDTNEKYIFNISVKIRFRHLAEVANDNICVSVPAMQNCPSQLQGKHFFLPGELYFCAITITQALDVSKSVRTTY